MPTTSTVPHLYMCMDGILHCFFDIYVHDTAIWSLRNIAGGVEDELDGRSVSHSELVHCEIKKVFLRLMSE